MTRTIGLLALLWCLPVATATATNLDGSRALVCTTHQVIDCAELEGCDFVAPGMVNLPSFVVVDVEKRQIRGDGRSTAIQTIVRENGLVLMQGAQSGRAWSMSLATDSGALTGAVTDDGYGFIVFGACTTLESLTP